MVGLKKCNYLTVEDKKCFLNPGGIYLLACSINGNYLGRLICYRVLVIESFY